MLSHLDGKEPSDAFMTHFQREYFHAQWKELLDDDFLEAYEHGVINRMLRRSKAAFLSTNICLLGDYPEKYVWRQ